MYSLVDYGRMLEDQVRVAALTQALKEVVPGKAVLELGGGTGFFACLASKFGAARVDSIDLNPLIQLGPRTAVANGLGNLHFFWGRSQEFQPEALFDVMLHDLRGNTPFYADSLATLLDARRFLKPGAVIVPKRDTVYACLVEDEGFYGQMEGVWGGALEGLDLRPFRADTHRLMRYSASPESRFWKKERLVEIDYHTFQDTSLRTNFAMEAEFDGTCHGLAVWFETLLTESTGFSNDPWLAPERRGSTYGVAFLPWPQPVTIEAGSVYEVEVAISSQGQYSGRLVGSQGSFRRQLARFTSGGSRDECTTFPLDGRLEKLPSARPYQKAVTAIEKGRSVKSALKDIQLAGGHRDEQTSINILSKSLKLTQGSIRRNRGFRLVLACADCRLTITTWDRDLQDLVRAKLAPSWKKLKRTTRSCSEIVLERVAHSGGISFSVTSQGQRTLHRELESALDRIELIVTEIVLPKSERWVVMDCGYLVRDSGVTLILDDDRSKRWALTEQATPYLAAGTRITVLDKDGCFQPYATGGGDLPNVPQPQIDRLLFAIASVPGKAVALTALNSRCLSKSALDNPLSYFLGLLEHAALASSEISLEPTQTGPDLVFPWYDSNWHRRLRLTQQMIERLCPEKLQGFNKAIGVFKTRQDFQVTKLPEPVFDHETLEACRQLIRDLPAETYETHEIQSMGRLVVHDHPFFTELQTRLVDLVSEVVGEAVEPYYNFLSLYKDMGACEVHMDTPEAKWTLDVCIDQSEVWPIAFSQIRPWPRFGEYQGDDWAEQIRQDPENKFTEKVLYPGEGLVFSGSSQWHYRDPIHKTGDDSFCHLVFFHYIPKGTRELLLEKNWSRLFCLPFET